MWNQRKSHGLWDWEIVWWITSSLALHPKMLRITTNGTNVTHAPLGNDVNDDVFSFVCMHFTNSLHVAYIVALLLWLRCLMWNCVVEILDHVVSSLPSGWHLIAVAHCQCDIFQSEATKTLQSMHLQRMVQISIGAYPYEELNHKSIYRCIVSSILCKINCSYFLYQDVHNNNNNRIKIIKIIIIIIKDVASMNVKERSGGACWGRTDESNFLTNSPDSIHLPVIIDHSTQPMNVQITVICANK